MQVSQHRNERTADSASTLACEQRLCSLVDYAAVAIAFVDMRGRLAHVNSSFADLLGYQADELLGRPFRDLLHPADRSRIVRLFLKVGLLRRQPRKMEFRALHKDGHTLHLMSKPTRAIQNGKTIGFQAILTDITERKKTEEELKKKEERYGLMFENMADAVAIYEAADDGRDFIIKDFNRAAERIEKLKKKDVIGKRVTEVFPGVEEFGLLGIFQRVWKTGRPEHCPAKVYKDKRIVGWRENRVYKLPSGEVVAIYEDVTEHKQTQDEAEKYRQFLEMIIDNSPDPIYIKTTDSTHLLVNKAHSNLLGKSKGEIQGRTDYELFSKEQADDFRKADKEVIEKGSIIDIPELRITDVNGFDHFLHTKKAPLKDDKGNVTHIIGVTRDITKRKQMEEEIRSLARFPEENPNPVLRLSQNGVILHANPSSEALLRNWECRVGDEAPQFWRSIANETYASQSNRAVDVELGENAYSFFVAPVKESGYVNLYGRDITERKRAEDTAERYLRFLETIIDNIPEPIVIKGKDSKHLIVNKPHLELTGRTRDEVLGKTDYELYPKEQAEIFRKEDQRALDKGSTINLPDMVLDDAKGFKHILRCRKTPLRNAEGNMPHIISVANDITESKKMEESLRESEEKYRAIVENSPNLILILQEGTIKYVNEVACKRSGWAFEELTSPSFNFIEKAVAKEFQGLVKDNMMKRLQGETIPQYEINLLSRDGSEFPVFVRAQRILYRGQPADLVILTDVTEIKRARKELVEHSEVLDNVLSSMSDCVYVLDEAYTIRFINEVAKKRYGFKAGTKCFKAIRNRDSPCHHSGIPCEIHEILEKGKDHFEDTRPDPNGILTHMLARPITIDGRRAVILVFRDITELKRSEEELKRLVSILHTTLESTADGILVVNKVGKISNYNQRFVEMFHISDPVMKSQDDRQLIEFIQKQVKDPEAYSKRTRELYAHPELERSDLLEFKDERVFERYSRPQQLGGEVIGRVISFRDVTERKRSEEALRSSEEFSSGLLENSLTPILVVNPDTSIRYVNPALERITGYSSSEVIGRKPPYPWWPKESIERVTKRLKDHMGNGAQYYEERWHRKNGEYFWVEINAASPTKDGLIKHYLSSWIDITERKKMEEELKRYSEHLQELVKEKSRDLADSEERYRRLIEESPQAIHVHCEGKFVYANPATLKLFGAERPEQLVGKPVIDFVHPAYREIVKERIRRINEEKVVAPYLEMKNLRLDGTEVDVAVVAIPTTHQGTPAIQVVTQDVADRKRMEKAKDIFMSAVTHELRTPLTSLKGYLELVMNELGPLPGQIKSDLEVVKRNTDRLLSLTNDLLDIQRMSSGKLQLNLEPLDLQEVIAEAATEISPLVQARKQSLNIEAPHHPLLINGDRIRLSQVLMNLLSNATKFAPEGGKIRINVRDDDALLTIEVSDPGIGIKEEDLEKVFEPFAVISKPTYIKGTGLGLSIVKGLVEAHGGKTWVESPGEGRGATFTCTLPRER